MTTATPSVVSEMSRHNDTDTDTDLEIEFESFSDTDPREYQNLCWDCAKFCGVHQQNWWNGGLHTPCSRCKMDLRPMFQRNTSENQHETEKCIDRLNQSIIIILSILFLKKSSANS